MLNISMNIYTFSIHLHLHDPPLYHMKDEEFDPIICLPSTTLHFNPWPSSLLSEGCGTLPHHLFTQHYTTLQSMSIFVIIWGMWWNFTPSSVYPALHYTSIHDHLHYYLRDVELYPIICLQRHYLPDINHQTLFTFYLHPPHKCSMLNISMDIYTIWSPHHLRDVELDPIICLPSTTLHYRAAHFNPQCPTPLSARLISRAMTVTGLMLFVSQRNMVMMDECFWTNAPRWCACQHRKNTK